MNRIYLIGKVVEKSKLNFLWRKKLQPMYTIKVDSFDAILTCEVVDALAQEVVDICVGDMICITGMMCDKKIVACEIIKC